MVKVFVTLNYSDLCGLSINLNYNTSLVQLQNNNFNNLVSK